MASDSRIKYLQIAHHHYPYTIEVEYKIENKESMFYPVWQPFSDRKQGVKKSVFTVMDKQNVGVRYKGYNMDEPQIQKDEESTTYRWSVENIRTVKPELFSASYQDVMPIVYLGAKNFEIEGFKGNMENWNNYAAWYYRLFKNKDDLKEQDVAEIKTICEPIQDTLEKIKAVYQYVQKNCRYVSVQLGIGGWQPMPASFVHRNKYGDCKALTFYTHCLLEAIDIPSYYTLIRAGRYERDVPEDFPVSLFNHAILTVPLQNDTLWLECTSQTNPFGYMGTFTSDRNCLVITENGGYLTRTKKYTKEENIQFTNVIVELDAAGNAKINLERKYTGLELENKNFISQLTQSERDKKKWLQDKSSYGNLQIENYEFFDIEGDIVPESGYKLHGHILGFAPLSAKRLFLRPFIFTNLDNLKLPDLQRENPIEIKYPFTHMDTLLVKYPDGCKIEKFLADYELETQFGKYHITCEEKDKFLYFTREFILYEGKYPKEEYKAFYEFINQVQIKDRDQIVLIKEL